MELKNQYEEDLDFAYIYIEEAHPTGEWIFKDRRQIEQHTSIEDRICEASLLQQKFPSIPVYVDTLGNELNYAFGAFPERLFVLLDGVVVYEGGSSPINYSLVELEKWINKKWLGSEKLKKK